MTSTSSPASAAQPCRIAVAGASGRMGRMLIEAVRASDDCVLAGALDQRGSRQSAPTRRLFWAKAAAC